MRFAVRSSLQAKAMRVAIVENAVVLAVALRELVEVLADQEGTDGVTGLEGERRFEEVEPAQCRKLVEHQ